MAGEISNRGRYRRALMGWKGLFRTAAIHICELESREARNASFRILTIPADKIQPKQFVSVGFKVAREVRNAMLSLLAQPEPGAVCRFCLSPDETVESGILIAPCGCKGSVRWVHVTCFDSWRKRDGGVKSTCGVCLERYDIMPYDIGPHGSSNLPVGLIPDALFSLAYSLLACLPLLMTILHSCDRSNILTRALRLCHVIPMATVVGLTLSALDWVAGRQHAGSSSLRCGLRMAIAFIVAAAGAARMLIWTFAAGGLGGVWAAHVAGCAEKRSLATAFFCYCPLIFVSLAFLPYCLVRGEKVHQATREALLRLRHRHTAATAGGGCREGVGSLFVCLFSAALFYLREGAYYVLIAMWSLAHIVFWELIVSRFLPAYLTAAAVVAVSV
ncbi:unnamed protein product [Vitrella brassicaformis CCMP3155]|uniref:RING-CH-type domain-containing protein n=1 Tax=Vitrella brassicaformis (strain CCMP3155) TaxID=1169540 RepID=A0A0G4FI58_VITBC|nr:unnamed protein product [Vitrella brassicaformis CCMP3155]|eukprot:CEM13143.1 unnamed protein product [Vitrella brassicaformis CCMP3155]